MKKRVSLLIVVAFALSLSVISCKSTNTLIQEYEKQLKQNELSLRASNSRVQALENENYQLKQRIIKLEADLRMYTKKAEVMSDFVNQMESMLAMYPDITGGVEIIDGGGLRFNEDFLFASGSAVLKEKPKALLKDIARQVKAKNLFLRIDGHTDTDPIRQSKDQWKTGSNFELGAHRALAVLLYLKKEGVPASNMFIASWGQHRPIGKSKAKNRRVEIFFTETPATLPGGTGQPEKGTGETPEKGAPAVPEKGEVPEKGTPVEFPDK